MPPETAALFARRFCTALNSLMPGWKVRKGVVQGPQGAAVRFSSPSASSSPGHVQVEFSFQDDTPDSLRLRDEVAGVGADTASSVRHAAGIWGCSSAHALLELKYSRKGMFATSLQPDDPRGLTGWHSICSPVLGWGPDEDGCGPGDGVQDLQNWWLSNQQALPSIASALSDMQGDSPHAISILFGGQDTAEVRVDTQRHAAASSILLAMDWPRQALPNFARIFVIALHRGCSGLLSE